jgi:hypothetical protein
MIREWLRIFGKLLRGNNKALGGITRAQKIGSATQSQIYFHYSGKKLYSLA